MKKEEPHLNRAENNNHDWPDVCNFLLLVLSQELLGGLLALAVHISDVFVHKFRPLAITSSRSVSHAVGHTGSSNCKPVMQPSN